MGLRVGGVDEHINVCRVPIAKTELSDGRRDSLQVLPIYGDISIPSQTCCQRVTFTHLQEHAEPTHNSISNTGLRQRGMQTLQDFKKLIHVFIDSPGCDHHKLRRF